MKQIIAIGSGGLDGDNPSIELYILAQCKKPNPKILFIATASGDNPGYIEYFKKYFKRFPCEPSHLSLFNPPTKDIANIVCESDVVFVGGGHTRNALVLWREWQVDKALHDAYNAGVILSGGSVGSVVWFDECITDSVPGKLTVMPCLGMLHYSNCPHYSSDARQIAYARYLAAGEIKNGYAIDDGAALHFVDGAVVRGISIDQKSKCFYVEKNEDRLLGIKHSEIETRYLDDSAREELVWSSPVFANLVE